MTNTSAVRGARVVGMVSGGPFNGSVRRYALPSGDSTATFIGDFVKSGGTALTISTGETLPTITQAAAGDTLRGVVIGFDPIAGVAVGSENLNRLYRPASTQMVAWVCDDQNALLEIQEDAVGGAIALVDIGENADIVVAAGSTATGMSGMQLDSSTHTTSSAQLRMINFVNRPDNTPASANAKLLVKINEHELASTTGV